MDGTTAGGMGAPRTVSVKRLEELEAENAVLRGRLEAANEEVVRWQRRAAAAMGGGDKPRRVPEQPGGWDVA